MDKLAGYFSRTIHASYEPKEDITTYELALLLGLFHDSFLSVRHLDHVYISKEKWNVAPENVKRHFKVAEDGKYF